MTVVLLKRLLIKVAIWYARLSPCAAVWPCYCLYRSLSLKLNLNFVNAYNTCIHQNQT